MLDKLKGTMSLLAVLLLASTSLVSAQLSTGPDLYGAVGMGSYGSGVPPQSYLKLTGRCVRAGDKPVPSPPLLLRWRCDRFARRDAEIWVLCTSSLGVRWGLAACPAQVPLAEGH